MKTFTRTDLDGMVCSATFSDCEAYRYDLLWAWSDEPPLTMMALNPSTATHETLDNTIKGMIKRARVWRKGGFRMLNLFGLRATKPSDMKAHAEPIGPDNDAVIEGFLQDLATTENSLLCGWGGHGKHRGRDAEIVAKARESGVTLQCLRVISDGSPEHPLYIPHALLPKPWSPPA